MRHRLLLGLSVFVIVVCFGWLVGIGCEPVSAQTAEASTATLEAGEFVSTFEELEQWCADHDGVGGTVFLSDSITIRQTISGGYQGGHVVIDTGAHGLRYDGGYILLDDFEIVGEGVDCPVLEVRDVGFVWAGNWCNILLTQTVSALGRDGLGGTAVRIEALDLNAFSLSSVPASPARISSQGSGAIGLDIVSPVDVYCLNVEVVGEGSQAVQAAAGTVFYFCRFHVEGIMSSATKDSAITFDTCQVVGSAGGAQVISRRISEVSGKRFYLPVKQADPNPLNPQTFFTFWLAGDDGSELRQSFAVVWDSNQLAAIDTRVLGKTSIRGELLPILSGLGLEDGFMFELVVDVRDPSLPCIAEVFFLEEYDQFGDSYTVAVLSFWQGFDASAGDILWCSDDGGMTWVNCTDSPDISYPAWTTDWLSFRLPDLSSPLQLYVQNDAGVSNLVTLYAKDGQPYGDCGGDRTGVDRNGDSSRDSSDAGSSGSNALPSGQGDGGRGPTSSSTVWPDQEAFISNTADGETANAPVMTRPADASAAGQADALSAVEASPADLSLAVRLATPEMLDRPLPIDIPTFLLILTALIAIVAFAALGWLRMRNRKTD